MEDYMASLSLEEVEEDFIQLGAESVDNRISYANCFVGMFLTSIVVHFQAMISILANVWHPIGGVSISDLENVQGENPLTVQLTEVNFWILVNDIPHDLTSKGGIVRVFFPIRAINPNQERDFKWYISLGAQSRRIVAWKSRFLMENRGEKGSSYGNSNINNGGSNLEDLQDGFVIRSGLGHSVNIVNGSFDDEMVIREEENSPMCNLDGLNRPRTLSFASGVSVNKDSIKVSAILMQGEWKGSGLSVATLMELMLTRM
ncbi:hypothetical protein Godav_009864 [Gossypium davidsonii]|uniref:DUF4283 domain-containing protein n=1 Tax=Gossypium davidsonii TaxID=34287 RepID=A0A7J8SG16_GOSDV|nr:hypothetical protein [Gossypium davidsonii]